MNHLPRRLKPPISVRDGWDSWEMLHRELRHPTWWAIPSITDLSCRTPLDPIPLSVVSLGVGQIFLGPRIINKYPENRALLHHQLPLLRKWVKIPPCWLSVLSSRSVWLTYSKWPIDPVIVLTTAGFADITMNPEFDGIDGFFRISDTLICCLHLLPVRDQCDLL